MCLLCRVRSREAGRFPSAPRRGGCYIHEISRSLLYGADGVVIKFQTESGRWLITTPSARANDASRLLIDRAATPPRRGGEKTLDASHRIIPLLPFAFGTKRGRVRVEVSKRPDDVSVS